ncbi:hypothetical protein [Spirosoma linguale]|uniref:Uncharacterized protein n=1 Tax=Spirosoma linguale (strain ATCC 33905 / DSM 74 / LMG 10896 / Claus 1) TaxID=504472 RepID=D2QPN1_SPILD|nr:hypothetical protein Slin_4712 [Spirosoma linguale DSM 74]
MKTTVQRQSPRLVLKKERLVCLTHNRSTSNQKTYGDTTWTTIATGI